MSQIRPLSSANANFAACCRVTRRTAPESVLPPELATRSASTRMVKHEQFHDRALRPRPRAATDSPGAAATETSTWSPGSGAARSSSMRRVHGHGIARCLP